MMSRRSCSPFRASPARPDLLLALLASLSAPVAASAETFEVSTYADHPGTIDGVCRASAFAFCTLREAILEANANPGLDTIEFHPSDLFPFPGVDPEEGDFVIRPRRDDDWDPLTEPTPYGPLPQITDPVYIDGTTHPDYDASNPNALPVVAIDGSELTGADKGLFFASGAQGSSVQGLAIYGGPDSAVHVLADNVHVYNNVIGLRDGTTYADNGGDGIFVGSSADGTVIGQIGSPVGFLGRGNLITGNQRDGIRVEGTNTRISGNRIGTDLSGNTVVSAFPTRFGNQGFGVNVRTLAGGTTIGERLTAIGGIEATSGNVISSNAAGGISIGLLANQAGIFGNRVGASLSGHSPIANGGAGIYVVGANAEIGDPGHSGALNVVGGNDGVGIELRGSAAVVAGNRIGVSVDAGSVLPNGGDGVLVGAGSSHEISGNVIGGNEGDGVQIDAGVLGAGVVANWIGTNASGDDLGNLASGVRDGGIDSVIGDTGAGNTIGFNLFDGIVFVSSSDGARVLANHIGANAGFEDIGNGSDGIEVRGFGHRIGDAAPGTGNVIGFNGTGIRSLGAENVAITGNQIGTNALGLDFGNAGDGIRIEDGSTHTLGATLDTAPVLISALANDIRFNGGLGIRIAGLSLGNTARGNAIRDNGSQAIGLVGAGGSSSDPGDFDAGPNAFQNAPQLLGSEFVIDPITSSVQTLYSVDSDVTASLYPIRVDFYVTDGPTAEPREWTATTTITAADARTIRSELLVPSLPVQPGERWVAIATDAAGNSSEVSQPIPVPEPSALFAFGAGGFGLVVAASRRSSSIGSSRASA